MIISQQALKEFRQRRLEDYSWIKDASKEELTSAIKSLSPKFNPKMNLFQHQLAGIYLGLVLPNFLYFLDMGLGKSSLALHIIQERLNLKQIKHALVVVPNEVNMENWRMEIKKATNLTVALLKGTKAKRFQALKQKTHIKVINYDGLKVMMTELKLVNSKKSTRKRVLDDYQARDFSNKFDLIVFDECHHLKHSTSLNFKLAKILSQHIDYRYGLTGTPMGRNPADLWAQFLVIDHGETLHTHESVFLHALFTQKFTKQGFPIWNLPKKHLMLLTQMIKNKSIRYADTECNDLPPIVFTDIMLPLADDIKRYFQQLVIDYQASGNTEGVTKKTNLYAKARQLCSGFVYEGNEDKRTVVHFDSCLKLQAVEEILNDVPAESKVIIAFVFIESGKKLSQLLTKLKIKHTMISGSSDNITAYNQFLSDTATKILLVNVLAGGEGLNLQVANYTIFYEPIHQPDVHRQMIKRTHRTGQTSHCFIFQLWTQSSVEEKIKDFLIEGKNLFDALIEGSVSITDLGFKE